MRRMISHTRFMALLGYTMVALLAASNLGSTRAQTEQRCFPETTFCIAGRIREFWEQNGGLPVFGFPVGSQQEELIEGRPFQVQWFERNRLELHPENAQPYDVLLGRLGADRLAQQGREWQAFPQSPAANGCRYFPETGHNACGDILAAWRASGLEFDGVAGKSDAENLALFGLPLSDPQTEVIEGKPYTVQWFERARFELHPENDPPYNVLLGLLGNEIRTGGVPSTPTPPTPTQPTPTLTPTPTATPTPTPTGESSAGIPAQLGFESPGPPQCLVKLDLAHNNDEVVTAAIPPFDNIIEVAAPFWICIEDLKANQKATMQITRPDDTTWLKQAASWRWRGFFPPGEPLGRYTITVTQGQRRVKGTFRLVRATHTHLVVYPQSGARGATFKIGLAGYQNDEDHIVPLHMYRYFPDTITAKYFIALPPARIDENGEAIVSLATKRNYPAGKYLVVAEPILPSYRDDDLGMLTLSR